MGVRGNERDFKSRHCQARVPGDRGENAPRAGMRHPGAEARARRGRQGKRSYKEAEAQGRAKGWGGSSRVRGTHRSCCQSGC